MKTLLKSTTAIAIASVLASCGGSDSGNNSSADGSGGTQQTSTSVVTQGVITGFGSVYVNGKRYRSENAEIKTDEAGNATDSDLAIGMVVSVRAQTAEGDDPEASEIDYEETLQGAVTLISTTAQTLEIMGQQVSYDEVTEFDDVTIDTLAIGDLVEVSGYETDSGFYATRIALETDEQVYKVDGDVAALDTTAKTFTINDLTVDYSQATFEQMSEADLANGSGVRVEGDSFDSTTNTLVASEVKSTEKSVDEEVDELEVAGVVGNYDAEAGSFVIAGYSVTLADTVEFEDGAMADLANGARIKIEAERVDSAWVVDSVEFLHERVTGKTEGTVTAVDADTQTIVIHDTEFQVTDTTRFKDESDAELRTFTFDDIMVNDVLKVIAKNDAEGNHIALKIKRLNDEDKDGELEGVATDIGDDRFTVQGVVVIVNESTEVEAEGTDDPMRLLALLASMEEPRVEVKGDYDGDTLVASKVEVKTEGDDDGEQHHGEVEVKGSVAEVNGEAFVVGDYEFHLVTEAELEIDDQSVDLQAFVDALEVGVTVEVEGEWQDAGYVIVHSAEIKTASESEGGDDTE
ncbi:hypothetical protein CWI84_03015 [Idiomarina tyrosinivorans]|uniref:DUF5666 domain-containing protein n=1 Tax=Idiomarina tyrosinivorans TaxID=1445662 RepID=A0A432ZT63_9GAMM|nr:DUF5666 domain-containing protein [Idiomarina tyrosinivorans]RUO81097.1 hypothetical protein CWI84_03015 [Idiomarina tyrosinivorans]